MSDLIQKKKEYLLAIPDAVNLVDASKLVAEWFVHFQDNAWFSKSKPKFQLENYICFHKDLRHAVYLDKDKFYLVDITKPKKVFGSMTTMDILIVTEILTDATDDAHLENASIAGNNFFRKRKGSEKIFLETITKYDEVANESFNDKVEELQQKIAENASEKSKQDEKNHLDADAKPQQAEIEQFYLFKDENIYVGDLVSIKFSTEKGRAVSHLLAENRVHDSNIVQVAMNFPDVLSDEFSLREKEIAAIEIRNIPKESLVLEEKGVDRALEEEMIGHECLRAFNKWAKLDQCRSKSAYILYNLSRSHNSIKTWAEKVSHSTWLDYYKGKTVDELKDACRKFHLKTSGDKESLVKRLASQMSPR